MHFAFKPPQLQQLDATQKRHATWLELFFDLVFVVAITQLSERLLHNFTWIGILQFIWLFIPVVWAWMGHTVYATRFDTDDFVHRVMTFVIMFAAAIMTVQIPEALEHGANIFALGYILARLALLFLYIRIFFYIPTARQMTLLYVTGFGLGVICWFISLYFQSPVKFWWWGLGLFIDFLTPWVGKKRILSKLPLDTSHIPERFGLFTIIVLGECVAAVILGLTHAQWNFLSVTTSLMAFILAILIWLQYYSYMKVANYKCSLSSGQPFIYSHYPLLISLVIISVSVEYLITSATWPSILLNKVNVIFCMAFILWLLSIFTIQYISILHYNFKFLVIIYIASILATLILLISSISPFWIVLAANSILIMIIICEHYFISKTNNLTS